MSSLQVHQKPVGPIAFGLMGLTSNARPTRPSYETSFAVMKTALAHGSNFWNGGQFYGTPEANSLHLLNAYFTKYPEDRSKIVLDIKGCFDRSTMTPDGSRDGVRRSIDECLHVLDGKAFIDIFEPARVDPKVPIEETVAAIAEYVKEGKIGGIGLSECSAETIRRAHKVHPISNVEVEVSLFSTSCLTNGVVQTCGELGISISAFAPLSHGFLTGQVKKFEDIPEGDMRRILPRFQPEVFAENLKLVEEVKQIAAKKGCTPGQVAINWVRALSGKQGAAIMFPLPGSSSVERTDENCTAVELSEAEVKSLDEVLARIPVQGARYPEALGKLSEY